MKLVSVLFVDLDGTIRESKTGEFVDGPEDIRLLPGREERLHGWSGPVIGITNQGGVAHGHKDVDQVLAENQQTRQLFDEDPFLDIEFSPFHPDGDNELFGHPSWSRKPAIGMLMLAEQFLISECGVLPDRDTSLMVGDMASDQTCAQNAGLDFAWAEEFFCDSQ